MHLTTWHRNRAHAQKIDYALTLPEPFPGTAICRRHVRSLRANCHVTEGYTMRADLPKLLAVGAILIIALCAIISTITLLQIRTDLKGLYNVTAKPHCYLSPNDPRRRDIERQWGKEPTTEGACEKERRD